VLQELGHEAEAVADGTAAWTRYQETKPPLVVLDIIMPGMDGIEVCRRIRQVDDRRETFILVLTGRDQPGDLTVVLDAGADDYVTKPFGTDELLARLRAALRRTAPETGPIFEIGELVVDLDKRSVTFAGEPVALTPNEFDLLRLFARNEGKLLTHPAILREVWGPAYDAESHYLHVYVSQLRRKLEPDPARPRYLLTEPGAGYRLVDPLKREV
jgi:two-component system KDP operon response regulator KdpE